MIGEVHEVNDHTKHLQEDGEGESQEAKANTRQSDQMMCIDILRMKCLKRVNFADKSKQIDSIPQENTAFKIMLMEALKSQLIDKLKEEHSFRHLMRKKFSKKQKHPSSVLTKTTAAFSIASTINYQNINHNNNNNDMSNMNVIESNNKMFGGSDDQSGVREFSCGLDRGFMGKQIIPYDVLIDVCLEMQRGVKEIESELVRAKNQRNQISETLEDYKDALIDNKKYLRDMMIAMDEKKARCEQLVLFINHLSRTGFSMQNRENLTSHHNSTLNSTRQLNTTFVDEAITKFKALKHFIATKVLPSHANQQQRDNVLSPRVHTHSSPFSNRILDFN